ncbi:MAG: helicase [Candidatus Eisenbacteria bacterium]|nr:helicase [Candidatus Eisenbacteria bacterium]
MLPRRSRPSGWYLTGFLIPSGTAPEQARDVDEDDELDVAPDEAEVPGESVEEKKAAKRGYFPSSMGLSFLVAREATALAVTVTWGDYAPGEWTDDGGKVRAVWKRAAREARVELDLARVAAVPTVDVPVSGGLQLHLVVREINSDELARDIPAGTRSVSIFLVNRRAAQREAVDTAFAFQPELRVECGHPFVPRPDLRGARAADWDERVSDLHYADTPEYATGHGVSAEWEVVEGGCRVVRTAWIPSAEVEKTETSKVPGVELRMQVLGELSGKPGVEGALRPLAAQYRQWIEARGVELASLEGTRRETADQLLESARRAARRIDAGVDLLANDEDALDAFRVANRAVAAALRKRLGVQEPQWRVFQLAFLLLNLPGITEPTSPERDVVDLLFFPTGGGKTEAYLGLAAFTMVLRRLRNPGDEGRAGAGVSVIMRYTLRLLTLDQLGRAAGLICALELEREKSGMRYGSWPFEIGLWVGKAATPNQMGSKGDDRQDTARAKVRHFKRDPRSNPPPIPIESCPWCGTRFSENSYSLLPNDDQPTELRITCVNSECDFTRGRALPIVAVDEPIYRRLPAFLIATLDKFASLPWEGPSGMLLGGAARADRHGFYGPAQGGEGRMLLGPLSPPDLIIQDELHLISGPLGTMAGLYETAIDGLCTRTIAARAVRPKVVASTATVRRARDQIQALFARASTEVFPPPGPDRRDSFFARTVPASRVPARLYLGVAAQGRNPKVLMRKVWVPLMAAAERLYREAGGHQNRDNPADPYMTTLGYFNSLRELGGARRILEEEVQNTIKGYGARRRVGADLDLFQDRTTFTEVMELTSRVPTNKVADARERLGCAFYARGRVDCAIATNMISVGLDISRLGLMVVLGQPKSTSEYIQATSRVGRLEMKPGLVVTLLNLNRPRDRSHYERFRHYHESFYRAVEVGSVTPFSARALDRGFAGAMVAFARHTEPALTPPSGAERLHDVRTRLEQRLIALFEERLRHQPIDDPNELDERLRGIRDRVVDLLDAWTYVAAEYAEAGATVKYQEYEPRSAQPLLRGMLEQTFESPQHRKFRANRSLRDVEPVVQLLLKELSGADVEEGA